MIELVILIAVLVGVICFLVYQLYKVSNAPRIEIIKHMGGKSMESRLLELKKAVMDLRFQLRKREEILKSLKEIE